MSCDYANSTDYLTIELTGTNGVSFSTNISAANLVVPYFGHNYNNTTPAVDENGTQLCVFALSRPSSNHRVVLGDPLLRSRACTMVLMTLSPPEHQLTAATVYVHYNLDQKTISMAEASYDTGASNIVAIGAGPVPSLTGTGDVAVGPSPRVPDNM